MYCQILFFHRNTWESLFLHILTTHFLSFRILIRSKKFHITTWLFEFARLLVRLLVMNCILKIFAHFPSQVFLLHWSGYTLSIYEYTQCWIFLIFYCFTKGIFSFTHLTKLLSVSATLLNLPANSDYPGILLF